MAQLQRHRKPGDEGHGGRDCSDPQMRIRAGLESHKVLAHRPGIADQAMCPHQQTLAFRRETLKTRRALYKRSVEHLLKTLDTKRQSRLRNTTAFGGTAKMLFARQGNHKLQFLKHSQLSILIWFAYREHRSPTSLLL